jgi:archaellum component FlaC
MPQMSEERFDRIDATLQKLGARFDAVDKRLNAFDARFDAVDKRLNAFDARFDAVDARFDAVDKRLDAIGASVETLKIKHEAMIQQFKGVSEGVGATNERLDRFERQVNDRFDKLTVDVRMVLDNHEVRIHDLEQR